MSATTCESCGMPLETGRYCDYCTDEHGELQSFDERFARMVDWQARRSPGTARADLTFFVGERPGQVKNGALGVAGRVEDAPEVLRAVRGPARGVGDDGHAIPLAAA